MIKKNNNSNNNRKDLSKQIIAACLKMREDGVNQGTAGNISVRFKDGMLITPSGMPYEIMKPEDIVQKAKPKKIKFLQANGDFIYRF